MQSIREFLTRSLQFKGRFCGLCGEKVVEKEDFEFRNYRIGELVVYTSFDGKFWNSLSTQL